MVTSAGTLSRVLSVASKHGNPKSKFLDVVATRLLLEGEHREIEASFWIRKLVLRVHDDISSLDFENERKARLRTFMNPFNGLQNLSHSYFDIANAKNNFLKPDHLIGLMNIDDALSGNVDNEEFDRETIDLAQKFRDLRNDVEDSDLAPRLKQDFSEILARIASMIENLNFYGPAEVQRELERIVGVIIVNRKTNSNAIFTLYRNICALVVPVFLAVQGVDQTLGSALSIREDTQEIIELFDEQSNRSELNNVK